MMTVRFSPHAIEQMAARGISTDAVRTAIATGDVIETQQPARRDARALVLAWVDGAPLHVLYFETAPGACEVITAYRPDPNLWDPDFRRRIR